MKLPKLPKFSYKGYVRYLRKQNPHMQRLHALVFASVLTGIIAFCILYYDYGFFHDVYSNEEVVQTSEPQATAGETFSSFFQEAKSRFNMIGAGGADLLSGKETYTNTSTSTP